MTSFRRSALGTLSAVLFVACGGTSDDANSPGTRGPSGPPALTLHEWGLVSAEPQREGGPFAFSSRHLDLAAPVGQAVYAHLGEGDDALEVRFEVAASDLAPSYAWPPPASPSPTTTERPTPEGPAASGGAESVDSEAPSAGAADAPSSRWQGRVTRGACDDATVAPACESAGCRSRPTAAFASPDADCMRMGDVASGLLYREPQGAGDVAWPLDVARYAGRVQQARADVFVGRILRVVRPSPRREDTRVQVLEAPGIAETLTLDAHAEVRASGESAERGIRFLRTEAERLGLTGSEQAAFLTAISAPVFGADASPSGDGEEAAPEAADDSAPPYPQDALYYFANAATAAQLAPLVVAPEPAAVRRALLVRVVRSVASGPTEDLRTTGVLGALGVDEASFSGDMALGGDPISALGALMGDPPAGGFGGLGLTGRGSERGEALGFGTLGLGVARNGRAEIATLSVEARADEAAVRERLQRSLRGIGACHGRGVNEPFSAPGKETFELHVDAQGRVANAVTVRSEFPGDAVGSCVRRKLRRMRFPATGPADVTGLADGTAVTGGAEPSASPSRIRVQFAFSQRTAPRRARVRPGPAGVRGNLSADVIRRVVWRHRNELRHCYELSLEDTPDARGRLVLRFMVSATGHVANAAAAPADDANLPADIARCFGGAARRWAFPQPDGGGVVMVTYPFVLSPPISPDAEGDSAPPSP